ncbi:hypothetical protein AAMO2058_001255100 [Amorphochlora amoebiformis]
MAHVKRPPTTKQPSAATRAAERLEKGSKALLEDLPKPEGRKHRQRGKRERDKGEKREMKCVGIVGTRLVYILQVNTNNRAT